MVWSRVSQLVSHSSDWMLVEGKLVLPRESSQQIAVNEEKGGRKEKKEEEDRREEDGRD